MIVLNNLTKSYLEGETRRDVLRDVSMEIRSGEMVAIQGRSGSGKSTLLNLIAGLDAPDSGSIVLSGQAINAMDEKRRTLFRRRHIGFVFQFYNLIPTLTVIENLRFCMDLNQIDEAAIRERVERLLEDIGLADRGDSYPDRLSGGEQQRVAIARAVAHRPDIVLADEPTGNLDEQTEKQILQVLRDMSSRHGVTMIIATHNDEVALGADRTLFLHEGKLD